MPTSTSHRIHRVRTGQAAPRAEHHAEVWWPTVVPGATSTSSLLRTTAAAGPQPHGPTIIQQRDASNRHRPREARRPSSRPREKQSETGARRRDGHPLAARGQFVHVRHVTPPTTPTRRCPTLSTPASRGLEVATASSGRWIVFPLRVPIHSTLDGEGRGRGIHGGG